MKKFITFAIILSFCTISKAQYISPIDTTSIDIESIIAKHETINTQMMLLEDAISRRDKAKAVFIGSVSTFGIGLMLDYVCQIGIINHSREFGLPAIMEMVSLPSLIISGIIWECRNDNVTQLRKQLIMNGNGVTIVF